MVADPHAMEATVDYAEAHLSQLLRVVAGGEEVVLSDGPVFVARILRISLVPGVRPKVGEVTSDPVRWTEESFAPLDEQGMKELCLL